MAQNTNLNVTPYYDDFDKDKNFYRVLFRPGFPIQARELTTMQSILQNQIESMGTATFKEGAMVIPGQVGYDLNVQAILIQESFLGSEVETYRAQLDGTIIEGLTTGVRAKVLYSISATTSEKGYITLYVKYIDSADSTSETDVKQFKNNVDLIGEQVKPEVMWIPETWGMENFSIMATASKANSFSKIGSSIINIYSRSPSLIAMGASTVDTISNGRLILGLGTSSVPIVEDFHGQIFESPVQRMRECVEIIRLALQNQKINYSGKIFSLKDFTLLTKPLRNKIPIYLAAINRKMDQLAW